MARMAGGGRTLVVLQYGERGCGGLNAGNLIILLLAFGGEGGGGRGTNSLCWCWGKKYVDLGCRQVFCFVLFGDTCSVHRFLDWIGQMECHRCRLSRKGKIKTHLLPAPHPCSRSRPMSAECTLLHCVYRINPTCALLSLSPPFTTLYPAPQWLSNTPQISAVLHSDRWV